MAQQTDDNKMKSTQSVTNIHTLTAVEFLFKELDLNGNWFGFAEGIRDILDKAKQIEKNRIEAAYEEGWVNGDLKKYPRYGEDYYKETYNK